MSAALASRAMVEAEMNAVQYWIERLRPWAERGFRRGELTPAEVILFGPDGQRVVLGRPGRWIRADAVPDLEAAVPDRTVTYQLDDGAVALARALLARAEERAERDVPEAP